MPEDFNTNQDTPEDQEWTIDALFDPDLLRLAFAHLPKNLPEVSEERLQNVLARCGFSLEIPDVIVIFRVKLRLERIAGRGAPPAEDSTTITADGEFYDERDRCSFTLYRGEESWKVSFRTRRPEFADKNVLLAITNNDNMEKITDTKKLTLKKKVWGADFSLPKHLNLVYLHTFEIGPLNNGEVE